MILKKNIILCGFMGSGKTTVGRLLAEHLGADFIDMDEYIEQQNNMSIPDIFKSCGEEDFRSLEHKAALALSQKNGMVVATGGGALTFERNVVPFKRSGPIIYLYVDFDECYRRIENTSRPLLEAKGYDGLRELYNTRDKLYTLACDYKVCAMDDPGEVAEKIIEAIGYI